MAAPRLEWYDSDDVLVETIVDLGADLSPSTDGDAVELRLYNDEDGSSSSDPAIGWWIQLLARDAETDPWSEAGLEILDAYSVEAQILGGLGGVTIDPVAWQALGPGRYIPVPTLDSTMGVQLEWRISPVADAQVASGQVALRLTQRRSVPVPQGLIATTGPGTYLGLGRWSRSGIVELGDTAGVVENPGGADDEVLVPDVHAIAEGRAYIELAALLQLDQDDGAAAALEAGESYLARIYLADTPGVDVVKGLRSATPAEPALPSDALVELALVEVQFETVITDSLITQRWRLWGGGLTSAALLATIGPEQAVVGDRLIETEEEDTVQLTESTTETLYRRTDGTLALGASPPSDDRDADPRWEITTDASAVTGLRNLRRYAGMGHELVTVAMAWHAELEANDEAYGLLPHGRDAQILPIGGVVAHVSDDADTPTAGSWVIDVEYRPPGGSWTTLFTSSGSTDRRPTIAFDAAPLSAEGVPEVTQIPGGSELRAIVATVPTATAGALSGRVYLHLALTG